MELMFEGSTWVLLDTETNAIKQPVLPVELGAQRMRGWEPVGDGFQCLINQNTWISQEASRVHGYTREILERDGFEPEDAYTRLSDYAGGLPVVSYNLSFDYDRVLLPEWKKMGMTPLPRGFCALKFAQRLLDPSPAGNCKLQTLRQYYRLPERGAHTALGDVETTADLLSKVLRPLADERSLNTWDKIVTFTTERWYPTRLPFGKHKGRDYREATADSELLSWLEWLAAAKREDRRSMALWYLEQLERPEATKRRPIHVVSRAASAAGIQVFRNPEEEVLKQAIAAAQDRLASVEAEYAEARHITSVFEAELFHRVGSFHRRRALLQLEVEHLEALLSLQLDDDPEAEEQLNEEYKEDQEWLKGEYADAETIATKTKTLSPEQKKDIDKLHRKLVRQHHPDAHAHDPDQREACEKLMRLINDARDRGDLDLMKKIASDPESYTGADPDDFVTATDIASLRRQYEDIVAATLMCLERLNELRESPRFSMAVAYNEDPEILDGVADQQVEALKSDIVKLKQRKDVLAAQML